MTENSYQKEVKVVFSVKRVMTKSLNSVQTLHGKQIFNYVCRHKMILHTGKLLLSTIILKEIILRGSSNIEWKTGKDGELKWCSNFTIKTGGKH